MDQKKIGQFLKQCRQENHLTQEQLAKMLGVTNRSVSRWENGVNMPDFDLVMEMASMFDISVEEFLDGQRKISVQEESKDVLKKIADYQESDKLHVTKNMHRLFWLAIISFCLYGYLELCHLTSTGVYEKVASVALGFVFGTLITGVLYTSRYLEKIKRFKKQLLKSQG